MVNNLITEVLDDSLTEAQGTEMGVLVQYLLACDTEIGSTAEHPLTNYRVFSKAHRVLKLLGVTWHYIGNEGGIGTFIRRS